MSFRIDRIASLYLFGPLARLSHPATLRIPILMYHSVSNEAELDVHPYYRTITTPVMFRKQMQFLSDAGYSSVTLDQIPEQVKQKRGNYVAITFDDGFKDFLDHAFPVLQRLGFRATVFLTTGFMGKEFIPFKRKPCLSWEDVRALDQNGTRFGSHTVNHPQLHDLPEQEIEREIRDSKNMIEDKIGKPVTSFSYPYAFPAGDARFTAYLEQVLSDSGYENGVSTRIGTWSKEDTVFFRKRIPVNADDDIFFFRAKVEGGYDWLRAVQYGSKLFRETLKFPRKNWPNGYINNYR